MSSPVTSGNYAPNGYEKVSPGHYRRREDDPEAQAAQRAAAVVNRPSSMEIIDEIRSDPFEYYTPPLGEFRKIAMPNPIDGIATLVRLLTYGETMELAAALWKMRPEGKEVTEQELPGIFHRWSAQP
jgi:hypothetical protein